MVQSFDIFVSPSMEEIVTSVTLAPQERGQERVAAQRMDIPSASDDGGNIGSCTCAFDDGGNRESAQARGQP